MSPSIKMDPPEINDRIAVIIEPHDREPDPGTVPVPPLAQRGIYRVTFALTMPGRDTYRRDFDVATLLESGESPLMKRPQGFT